MKDVTITIPDNCELIKKGNSYVITEKDTKPKSWEDFCENFPLTSEDCYIDTNSTLSGFGPKQVIIRNATNDKNYCISWVEAEAFLALMQLRQLRKAWVGDWEQPKSATEIAVIEYNNDEEELVTTYGNFWTSITLSFPTLKMAKEFLECFGDLCETAKCLL